MDLDVEVVNVGSTPIFYKLLKDEGILADLEQAYGESDANLIVSIASCLLETGQVSPEYFMNWKTNRYLPPFTTPDREKLQSIWKNVALFEKKTQEFFSAQASHLDNSPVTVDVATYKDNELLWPIAAITPQPHPKAPRGLMTVLNSRTRLPVLIQPFPSDFSDIRALFGFLMTLREYGIQKIDNVVLGQDYFSDEALTYAYQAKAKCTFILPESSSLYKEYVPKALEEFETGKPESLQWEDTDLVPTRFVTYKLSKDLSGVTFNQWLHIYNRPRDFYLKEEDFYDVLDEFQYLWDHFSELRAFLDLETWRKYFKIKKHTRGSSEPEEEDQLVMQDNEVQAAIKKISPLAMLTTWDCSAKDCFKVMAERTRIAQMVNEAVGATLSGTGPSIYLSRTSAEADLFFAFIGLLALELIKKHLDQSLQNPDLLKEAARLVTIFPSRAKKILSVFEGFSYLRRKSTKTLFSLPISSKQALAAELCGCKGILNSVFHY